MKKINKNEIDWLSFIILIVIVLVIEIIGDYYNRHAEEHRKESWERFEKKNAEIMNSVDWSKESYR